MKTQKYTFYIGWNNQTKKREIIKAIRILNKLNVMGFNVNKDILGFWNKTQEKSFIIESIATEENPFNITKAKEIKTQLERELKQFVVLTTIQDITII